MLPETYLVKKLYKKTPIEVSVPGSKSITNRALLIAALADGKSTLRGVLFSEDSRNFLQALIDLGFEVSVDEANREVTITGCGGRVPCASDNAGNLHRIYVGSAGTAARFLTAYLGLSEGTFVVDSSEQMKRRPMKELLTALEELGTQVSYLQEEYHFPFAIGCEEWRKNEVTINVDKSSQFLSALLIVSVLSKETFSIHVTGNHGMAYVDMTVRMMAQFGVTATRTDEADFVIAAGQTYRATDYQIEPDISAACYFYAMSPVLGVQAKVHAVHRDCMQGDIRFLQVLSDMGCTVEEEKDGIRVFPPEGKMRGGEWDLSGFSDQALTLAAIAPFAEGRVVIQKVGHIRLQECDRIQAILMNLRALGVNCSEEDGTITIEPGRLHGANIETCEDHRVAMAFSIPGLAIGDVVIWNPSCCRKTFENYFEVLDELYRL